MKIKEQILNILEENKGRYISGEEIAEILSVSRNSVWKGINSLKKDGHIICAVTNKGYCLSEDSSVFTAQSIYAGLSDELREKLKISVVSVVDSTNTVLKSEAENGGAEGTVLIATEQTAGRGRLGRTFFSPKNTGLYMSIILRPELTAAEALMITTSAAVSAAECIDSVADVTTRIKWVNDIYLNGKKVCGILTEASIDFESGGLNYAVLGIGINLTTSDFPDELKGIAASVSECGNDLRSQIASEFLNRFFGYYGNLSGCSFLSEYRRRSMLIGENITLIRGNDMFNGKVIGIDDEVRLVVELENKEIMAFSSGEVQLKKGGIIK